MKIRSSVFLGVVFGILGIMAIAATANAQALALPPLSSVAHELNKDEAARAWTVVGISPARNGYRKEALEDFSYPLFPGVITVENEPNGSRKRRVFLTVPTSALATGGSFVARIIYPNRDAAEIAAWGWGPVNQNPAESGWYGNELIDWSTFRQGIYRVEVFFQEGSGRISKIAANIPVGSCCPSGPQIGSVGIASDGVTININTFPFSTAYKNPVVAVAGVIVKITSNSSTGIFAQTFRLDEGEWIATLCDQGECTSRPFYFSPSFNNGSGGGKGSVPGGGSATQ